MAIGMEVDSEQLRQAVELQHKCVARFTCVKSVSETFLGAAVWDGVVHVFDLSGHPTATRAYAWSSSIEGSTKRRFYAVLHVPPRSTRHPMR